MTHPASSATETTRTQTTRTQDQPVLAMDQVRYQGEPVPAEDGGVDLFVATQWLHADRGQVAASLGLPEPAGRDLRTLPGGVSNATHGEGVVRGVGYAIGIKNVCFSEGFDDYSTVRVRLELAGGEPTAQVHTAAAEVGQGLVTP